MGLKERLLASNAPAWIYEAKGDMLLGTVVNRSTRTSDYGPYEIITVEPDEAPTVGGKTTFKVKVEDKDVTYAGGPLAWHAMGTVAARRVEESDPQPGDRIGILFDGEKVAQSGQGKGKKYDVIQVVVEKAVLAPETRQAIQEAYSEPAAYTTDDTEDYSEDEDEF